MRFTEEARQMVLTAAACASALVILGLAVAFTGGGVSRVLGLPLFALGAAFILYSTITGGFVSNYLGPGPGPTVNRASPAVIADVRDKMSGGWSDRSLYSGVLGLALFLAGGLVSTLPAIGLITLAALAAVLWSVLAVDRLGPADHPR